MLKELKEINEELASIESRAVEIRTESETAENLETLSQELDGMEARKAELLAKKAELEAREQEVQDVADGKVEAREIPLEKGEKKMTLQELRSSQEYINAYAEYLKTGKDEEVRALLSDQVTVSGTAGVPTPTYVEERIMTAWDQNPILSRVRRTNIKGIIKVGFELSASPAAIHPEGSTTVPAEENLALGVVELKPETIKKWISVSDEVMDMHGQAFLDYIFDEIEYRIVKKAADMLVADVVAAPQTATTSAAAVAKVTVTTPAIGDFVNAFATLSDEAENPVIIMNKQTYAMYKNLQFSAQYAVDPFNGMEVLFNDTLVNAGQTGVCAIVGDLNGLQANFPNGFEPTIKYDEYSLSEKDLVKIVGRLPMGHGVIASGRFCVLAKAA